MKLRWYISDRYGLLITVGDVGGDFSQTSHSVDSPEVRLSESQIVRQLTLTITYLYINIWDSTE